MEPKGGGSINYKDGPLMNFIAVRCVGHIIHFIFPFRPVVCLLVNGIAFHTETNAFMNNNAEPRSFPFPFREV